MMFYSSHCLLAERLSYNCATSTSDTEVLECVRSVVWPHDGPAVAPLYGERNGRIKDHFDRGQLPSLEYGEFSEFEPQCVYQKSDTRHDMVP